MFGRDRELDVELFRELFAPSSQAEGGRIISPSAGHVDSPRGGSPVSPAKSSHRRECAGLQVSEVTLSFEGDNVSGHIKVDVSPRCILSERLQETLAMGMANDLLRDHVKVEEWQVLCVGSWIFLSPMTWEGIAEKAVRS